MTTTTDTLPPATETAPALEGTRGAWRLRFGVAFLVGLLAVLVLGVGAIYAYEQAYNGRILPGVKIGTVDVSGMDRAQATAALSAAYRALGEGQVVIHASAADVTIPYADFGRRADVVAMVESALAVGRTGTPIERAVAEVRTVVRGVSVDPEVVLDADALAARIDAGLDGLELTPVDATITLGTSGFQTTIARVGRSFDHAAVRAEVLRLAASRAATGQIVVQATPSEIRPAIEDAAVETAMTAAERMIADVDLASGTEHWTIPAATVQGMIRFATTPDGRIDPTVDRDALTASLADIAKKVEVKPVDATFLIGKAGSVVGVTASQDGRTLDVGGTVDRIAQALAARAGGQTGPVQPAFITSKPTLSTADAEKAAPLMTKISSWTTWFPINDHNAYGANIWLPALKIDGYVLGPGKTFDFWTVVGQPTLAQGYGMGGVIVNGHTEPQGALAGGICSCSTTLFNAALRAGLQMGARANHYYYIDRYPLGLDATVFISGSGSRQSMSFTNDTRYPILIRGIKSRSGSRGYVTFELWSVPTGRNVSFSTPIVKNVLRATTLTQYTSTIPVGTRQQTEYPADGKDVWVTRTVTDANGNVIHSETYYSHYARVDGIILIGVAAAPAPAPTPAPVAPSPSPEPAPSPTASG